MKKKINEFLADFFHLRAKREQLKLLNKSVLLDEGEPPFFIKSTIVLVSFVFLCFFTWAASFHVSEIVKSSGEVIPSGNIRSIQHLEGGIVSSIYVEEGDVVEEGQVVLRLQNKSLKSEYNQLVEVETKLKLKIERLNAFLAKRNPKFESVYNGQKFLVLNELALYESMNKAYDREKEVIESQLEQKEGFYQTLINKKDNSLKSYRIAKEDFVYQNKLYQKGLAVKSRVIASKKEKAEKWSNYSQLKKEIEQAQDAVEEFRFRLNSLESNYREKYLKELELANSELSDTTKNIFKLNDQIERLNVTSPVTGVVKGIEVNSIGAVVIPGKKILDVVPTSESLVAILKVKPEDIGQIREGQQVIVKVSSYDFARYGAIDGKVKIISPSTFSDERKEPFYKVSVELQQNFVGSNPFRNIVLPGMVVEGQVVTGSKTILAYLLKPIHASLSTAFSER